MTGRTHKTERTGSRNRGSRASKRSTAVERRRVLVDVATSHFAERGYYGTPTLAIADEAGISQAYLFRLFPTKQDLFAACVESCIAKTNAAFEAAADAPFEGEAPLEAMGRGYAELLGTDPTVLVAQLHANAAAAREPKIRDALRVGWARLYETVASRSGAGPDEIRPFFAEGMLRNVAVAAGFDSIKQPWAKVLGSVREDGP